MSLHPSNVKVYTVNGAAAGSALSLPDWLTRKREAKAKGKRGKERYEGTIELIQGFEFPEASNRIKTTRDGHHAIATGTYKPQMRVWDLDQLTLKFERHSDAENVDFIILSDDWTKTMHLQNDRTVELHTQGGFHYRTRIPRFGRALAYHFPSCDAYIAASGNEVYRLNLEQGRFMNPLVLQDSVADDIQGVNVVDINPVHQLLAFGVDGNGTVQLWDPRSRSSVGILRLPRQRLLSPNQLDDSLGVTALSSRSDGLSYAVGTSTGHTLLYDIRTTVPFAIKDQGYGLPVTTTTWITGGSRMAGDGMVLSADKKVIKIWDRNSPSSNFASVTPATDLNDVHHVPGSGLILTANEGIQMSTFYIPQLGPAPRWASFLENITEEMEDQTTRSVYEDYKFVERSELSNLGLDHLIGTPALKPYMHGYFISLKLYDTARVIANPFAYEEHRERLLREKMDKMAETRIRTKKDAGVKINKALAERLLREEEKKAAKKAKRKQAKPDAMVVDEAGRGGETGAANGDLVAQDSGPVSILSDPRFKKVFEDPAFAIDENSREYALLHPSAVAGGWRAGKTAVEEEEDESDVDSSDGLGGSDEGIDDDEDDESDGGSTDSSTAGDLADRRPRLERERSRATPIRPRTANVSMAPLRPQLAGRNLHDKNSTFGQRRLGVSTKNKQGSGAGSRFEEEESRMEISWVPSSSSGGNRDSAGGDTRSQGRRQGGGDKRKGVERFGAGLERGVVQEDVEESQRKGRTHRRHGIRSGSKNAFRRI